MGSNSLDESSPKNSRNSKNSANYKANCLTPRSCPVCARVYSNVSNLRQHMRLIHNPTAVICPICQKVRINIDIHSDIFLINDFNFSTLIRIFILNGIMHLYIQSTHQVKQSMVWKRTLAVVEQTIQEIGQIILITTDYCHKLKHYWNILKMVKCPSNTSKSCSRKIFF